MIPKNFSYLLLLTLTATLGGLLFGYDTAVVSGTVESLKEFFIEPYGWTETRANAWHGMVVSSALVGSVPGAEGFYGLLDWKDGTFSFEGGDPALGPGPALAVQGDTMALLMEGLRRIDERGRG